MVALPSIVQLKVNALRANDTLLPTEYPWLLRVRVNCPVSGSYVPPVGVMLTLDPPALLVILLLVMYSLRSNTPLTV